MFGCCECSCLPAIRYYGVGQPQGQPLQTPYSLLSGVGGMLGASLFRIFLGGIHNYSQIHALDFSEGMLNYAHKKNVKYYASNVNIISEDVLKNQLPSNHFDVLVCSFGLKTFNNEQLHILAKEVKRILKPNGRFSFIEISQPANTLLNALYGFYIGNLIPILGKLLLGNPEQYKMLWTYTKKFKNAQKAQKIFEEKGLESNYQSYFFGCATGFTGIKSAG